MNSIYKDPAKLVEAVHTLVRRFIPDMLPGHSFDLRSMCGDAFWLSLSRGQKSLAGTIMAHMVTSNLNLQIPASTKPSGIN